jgi:hypothetical protein
VRAARLWLVLSMSLLGTTGLLAVTDGSAGAAAPHSAGLRSSPDTSSMSPRSESTVKASNKHPDMFSRAWGGYGGFDTKPFTYIQSTWVQPTVTCPVSGAEVFFWVGLDGLAPSDTSSVEQDGTGATCNGSTPTYYAWWEMWPTNIAQTTFAVSPGDRIKASVTYEQTGVFDLTVQDLTTGAHDTEQETCGAGLKCDRESAEWVVEPPTVNTVVPLADFGNFTMTDNEASVVSTAKKLKLKPLKALPYDTLVMSSNSPSFHLLANPSTLNKKANSFTDTWLADQ